MLPFDMAEAALPVIGPTPKAIVEPVILPAKPEFDRCARGFNRKDLAWNEVTQGVALSGDT
jgi:hypothetical protein